MRKKLPILAMLVAWSVAAGGQWEMLQVFAWAKMFSGYAQTMSLADSWRATFEPENRCPYCKLAEAGRQRQENSPAAPASDSVVKFLLVLQPAAEVVVTTPACAHVLRTENKAWPVGRAAPPTPPPRAIAA